MKWSMLFVVAFLAIMVCSTNTMAQSTETEKTKAEQKAEKKAEKKKAKADRKAQTEEARKASRDYARYTSLADILRQQPGVIVMGSGQNVRIEIRGQNSMNVDTRPLFVYDGVRMGRDYAQVNNAVDRQMIKSIRILSSLSETNFYGEDGRNGVIVIKSNRTKNN
jgi:Na+-transporting methylmalonyl-CoA/oxaloacetate decarboxylase gamma subunit